MPAGAQTADLPSPAPPSGPHLPDRRGMGPPPCHTPPCRGSLGLQAEGSQHPRPTSTPQGWQGGASLFFPARPGQAEGLGHSQTPQGRGLLCLNWTDCQCQRSPLTQAGWGLPGSEGRLGGLRPRITA